MLTHLKLRPDFAPTMFPAPLRRARPPSLIGEHTDTAMVRPARAIDFATVVAILAAHGRPHPDPLG